MDISRDWGWAPDYLEAIWLMLQQQKPVYYVIATGDTFSLQEYVSTAFELSQLDRRDHVVQDVSLFRPSDIMISSADPTKAKLQLNWTANLNSKSVVQAMLNEQEC